MQHYRYTIYTAQPLVHCSDRSAWLRLRVLYTVSNKER